MRKQSTVETEVAQDLSLDIPESWVRTNLGGIVEKVQYGATASAKSSGHYQLLRITDLTSVGVNWIDVPFCDLNKAEGEKYLLNDGDIVIARTGGTVGKSFRIVNPGHNAIFASYLIRLVPNIKLRDERFLELYLKSNTYWESIQEGARGAAQPNVNSETLKQIPFPLPPLGEQKRIVVKIEATTAKIEIIDRAADVAEKLLQNYRESILAKAFRGELVPQDPSEGTGHDLLARIRSESNESANSRKKATASQEAVDEVSLDIPGSWAGCTLKEVARWGSGGTPSRGNSRFYGGDINWLKTGDLNDSVVSQVEEKITKAGLEEISGGVYPPGTLIMAMYGATIGKLGILDIPAATNQACACAQCYEGVQLYYLFYWLRSQRKSYIEMGRGGGQPNISRELIYKQPFALPPLAEQKRIVAAIEKHEAIAEGLKATIANLKAQAKKLRESILAAAFSGKLVPQDPSEGTGHELLAQIRAATTTKPEAKAEDSIEVAPKKPRKKRAKK